MQEGAFEIVFSCSLIRLHSSYNSYLCDVFFVYGDAYVSEVFTLNEKKCKTPLFLDFFYERNIISMYHPQAAIFFPFFISLEHLSFNINQSKKNFIGIVFISVSICTAIK